MSQKPTAASALAASSSPQWKPSLLHHTSARVSNRRWPQRSAARHTWRGRHGVGRHRHRHQQRQLGCLGGLRKHRQSCATAGAMCCSRGCGERRCWAHCLAPTPSRRSFMKTPNNQLGSRTNSHPPCPTAQPFHLEHVREQEEQARVHAGAQANGGQHPQADPPNGVGQPGFCLPHFWRQRACDLEAPIGQQQRRLQWSGAMCWGRTVGRVVGRGGMAGLASKWACATTKRAQKVAAAGCRADAAPRSKSNVHCQC